MSGLGSWFGWGAGGDTPADELPLIFPLDFKKDTFIEIDTINIYQKILTDVMERTHGLKEQQTELLWDNCIQSAANHGLISILARGMAFKKQLFLVYSPAIKVLRLATPSEQSQIIADYKAKGESKVGVFISFEHYLKSDLVRLYSALEYITIASLNKSMNLSVATQLKMNDLRASTSLADSADVKAQAVKIAKALSCGRDVLLDAKDVIDHGVPDLVAVEKAIAYLHQKKAFYLGMPSSYITGEQTGGIGSTGEGDTKAIERGLKNFYHSVARPVLEVLFQAKTTYKTQDFRQVDQGINALKTFAITDDELISVDNKTLILNRLFDLPEDAEGDEPEDKETLPPDQVDANNSYPQV